MKALWMIALFSGLGLARQAAAQMPPPSERPPVRDDQPNFSPWFDPEYPPRTHDEQGAKPYRIFDNLYYVGLQSVASFLLTTSDGLILIDPTYDFTADLVLKSVVDLGFKPGDIRYLLVTHGHADHVGGTKAVRDATGARVVMAAGDWELYEDPGAAYAKVPRDIVATDGETLTLGDTTIRFHITPGHTPGCLSMEFTVFDRGKPMRALAPGGLGLPSTPENVRMYLQSVQKMRAIEDIQVLLPDHPFMGDFWLKAQKLPNRKSGDPHAFVTTRLQTLEWFDTLYNALLARQFFEEKQREAKARREQPN